MKKDPFLDEELEEKINKLSIYDKKIYELVNIFPKGLSTNFIANDRIISPALASERLNYLEKEGLLKKEGEKYITTPNYFRNVIDKISEELFSEEGIKKMNELSFDLDHHELFRKETVLGDEWNYKK